MDSDVTTNETEDDGGQAAFDAAQAEADRVLESMDGLDDLARRLLQQKLLEQATPELKSLLGGEGAGKRFVRIAIPHGEGAGKRFVRIAIPHSGFTTFTPGPETFGGEGVANDWQELASDDDELRVWAKRQLAEKKRKKSLFRDVVAGGLHVLLEKIEGPQPAPRISTPINPLAGRAVNGNGGLGLGAARAEQHPVGVSFYDQIDQTF